jgi:hypothetical protein
MGLKQSGRIVAPDGIPVLGFFRSHTLYHCYGVARSQYDGLHHIQLTVKDPPAVYAAYEKIKQGGQVKLIWGPLRHGAGHNIAFYVHDYTGTIVEYSAEEEIIRTDTALVPGLAHLFCRPLAVCADPPRRRWGHRQAQHALRSVLARSVCIFFSSCTTLGRR